MSPVRTAACRHFLAAWHGWRSGALLPSRHDVRLEDIRPLLSSAFLLELRGPDEVIFRLAGTRLAEHLGFDPTGRNLIALTPPDQRAVRAARFMAQASRPCGSRFVRRHCYAGGLCVAVEHVALPIRPYRPDAPLQLLNVAGHIEGEPKLWDPGEDQTFELAVEFAYLDLGAGIPADTGASEALRELV